VKVIGGQDKVHWEQKNKLPDAFVENAAERHADRNPQGAEDIDDSDPECPVFDGRHLADVAVHGHEHCEPAPSHSGEDGFCQLQQVGKGDKLYLRFRATEPAESSAEPPTASSPRLAASQRRTEGQSTPNSSLRRFQGYVVFPVDLLTGKDSSTASRKDALP